MALSAKYSIQIQRSLMLTIFSIIFHTSILCAQSNAQENDINSDYIEENNKPQNPVWTDENWQKAKEGIEYTEEKKKEEKEEEEEQDNGSSEPKLDWDKDNSSFNSPSIRIIVITIIFILLLYLIIRLLSDRRINGKKKIKLQLEDFEEITEEHLHETDLERFLRMALEKQDHKTAVRILYLIIIQHLHQRSWILWKKEKTNRDYLLEMRSQPVYNKFKSITLIYEIIWYGDKEITPTEYTTIQPAFQDFIQIIKLNEKK